MWRLSCALRRVYRDGFRLAVGLGRVAGVIVAAVRVLARAAAPDWRRGVHHAGHRGAPAGLAGRAPRLPHRAGCRARRPASPGPERGHPRAAHARLAPDPRRRPARPAPAARPVRPRARPAQRPTGLVADLAERRPRVASASRSRDDSGRTPTWCLGPAKSGLVTRSRTSGTSWRPCCRASPPPTPDARPGDDGACPGGGRQRRGLDASRRPVGRATSWSSSM